MGMYCKKCYYDLSHCETHECPECGRLFEPDRRRSYSKTPYPTQRHARMPFRIAIMVTAVCVLAYWAQRGPALLSAFQFPSSNTPYVSSMVSQHQTLNSQLTLYANQHNNNYPTLVQMQAWDVLTKKTDIDGNTGNSTSHIYGPYLLMPPLNNYTSSSGVAAVGKATPKHGWEYDESTGDIRFVITDPVLINQWNLDPQDVVVVSK
ncbi:MAG: hypothetical protein AAF085_10325 [Planctomycetota bacterium]